MAQTYEIEIKSLLGGKEKADALIEKMCELDSDVSCVSKNKQLNHYFVGDDLSVLVDAVAPLFDEDATARLKEIAEHVTEFSVRTRFKDGTVLFIVKASVDDTSSSNGISRVEFEEPVDLSLEELDSKILGAGFSYQAKWSREREEYVFRGANVCMDKNAGYGYLAEFEKIVSDQSEIPSAQEELRAIMEELGVEELPQERLERMFTHYNKNWEEYYGTDNTFVIE
ncbi:hypothetical protein COU15_02975 [Candidatus Kaiserbacteria bacterium CG10_big_fil_rev_8_21_14_0_10_45_20]|uniref:CYTH domain-containing protein n=1 Tax=Candidatus Kaiserbacteria bacterium CG10_big_fil_rev_8_21_14_0_10_45_20 TaxID=1974607 RepID=A0A2H0UF53_9BACT|nr:MAG: hypothetical protein COU15_02975 [Candidatus Kaiserbacteria bacterium CG10_big_fil_rev_8_21_14_0_10_45_20]